MSDLRLAPDQLEALADMIAARMHEPERGSRPRPLPAAASKEDDLVDASTLARRLGVSRSTIYEHATELGALELGDGDRPRLRFDPDRALEAWTRRSYSRESQPATKRTAPRSRASARRRRLGSTPDLLPIRGASRSTSTLDTNEATQRRNGLLNGAGSPIEHQDRSEEHVEGISA